jgi:hypothetical protein
VVVAAVVVEVGEELEHLDEDHARKAQQCVVGDEVVDIVGAMRMQRQRRLRVAALLPEEATQRQAGSPPYSVKGRTRRGQTSREPGGSRKSADQTE